MASALAIPADTLQGCKPDQLPPSPLASPIVARDAFPSTTSASSTSSTNAQDPNPALADAAQNQHLAYLQALPQNFARMVQLAANGALGPAAMALCRNYVDALHQSVSSAGKSESSQAAAGSAGTDSAVSAACSNLFSLVSTLSNPFVLNALNTSGASTTSSAPLPPPPAVKESLIGGNMSKRTYTEMESAYNFDNAEDASFDRFRAYSIRRNSRDVMLQDLSELSALVTWDRADARHHNFYYYQGKNCSSAATRHPELPQFGVKSTLARSCVACLVLKSTTPAAVAAAAAVSPAVNAEASLKRAKGANGAVLPTTPFHAFVKFTEPEVTPVHWNREAPTAPVESVAKTPVFHEVLTDSKPALSRPARPSSSFSAPNLSALYNNALDAKSGDFDVADEYPSQPSPSSTFSSSPSYNPATAGSNVYQVYHQPSRPAPAAAQSYLHSHHEEPKQRKVRSETPEMMQLKAQTRDALARLNLNQSALARALNIKQSYISRWLHNKHTPGMEDQIVAPIREWLNSKTVTSLLPGGLAAAPVASPSRSVAQHQYQPATHAQLAQPQQQQQPQYASTGASYHQHVPGVAAYPATAQAAVPLRRSPPAFSSATSAPRPPALSTTSLSGKSSFPGIGTSVGLSPMLLSAAQAPQQHAVSLVGESAASQSQTAVAASTLSTPSSPATPPSPSAPLSAPTSISSSASASPLASFAACRPASSGVSSPLFKTDMSTRAQTPASSLIFSTVGSLTASTRGPLMGSRLAGATAARPVPIISAVRGNVSARSLSSASSSTSPVTLSTQAPASIMALATTTFNSVAHLATTPSSVPSRSALFSKPSL